MHWIDWCLCERRTPIVRPVEDQWQVVSETKHQLELHLQVRRTIVKRSWPGKGKVSCLCSVKTVNLCHSEEWYLLILSLNVIRWSEELCCLRLRSRPEEGAAPGSRTLRPEEPGGAERRRPGRWERRGRQQHRPGVRRGRGQRESLEGDWNQVGILFSWYVARLRLTVRF